MSDQCGFCFGTGRYRGIFGHNDPLCPNCNGTGKTDAMKLGMEDQEVIRLNRDLTDPARKVKALYYEIIKGDDSKQDEFLVALLEWRDAVKSEEG